MEFYVNKCKVMHVGRQKDSCSYYMGGMKLTEEEAEKDVGGLDLIRHEVFSAMYVCI